MGDFDEGFHQLADVESGGFAFDAGANGEDDFGDVGFAGATDQGLDAELIGADAVHGGNHAAEDMVAAPIFAGFFEGNHIAGIGDDAEGMGVTGAIATNRTNRLRRQMKTGLAQAHLMAGIDDRRRQLLRLCRWPFENMQGETLGRLGANAGQFL